MRAPSSSRKYPPPPGLESRRRHIDIDFKCSGRFLLRRPRSSQGPPSQAHRRTRSPPLSDAPVGSVKARKPWSPFPTKPGSRPTPLRLRPAGNPFRGKARARTHALHQDQHPVVRNGCSRRGEQKLVADVYHIVGLVPRPRPRPRSKHRPDSLQFLTLSYLPPYYTHHP